MSAPASAFTVERVRHPIVVRTLTVVTIESLCPNYVRMGLAGPDLDGFVSMGFDDHVKIFFAASATKTPVIPYTTETGVGFPEGSEKPVARDYTPRHYDAEKGVLEVDFVLHDDGPAGSWARQAKVGDTLTLAGPRGSMVIPKNFDWHLLIGDETAFPAISRRLAELPKQVVPIVVLALTDPELAHHLPFHPLARVQVVPHSDQGQRLTEAIDALELPAGQGYAWAAAESAVVKHVRESLVQTHGLNNKQIKASSYWRCGAAGFHETLTH